MLAPLPDPDQWCDDNAERPWLLAATPPTDLQKRVRAPAATNSGPIVRYPDRSRYWVRQVTKAPLRSAMAALSFSFPISISRIPEYNDLHIPDRHHLTHRHPRDQVLLGLRVTVTQQVSNLASTPRKQSETLRLDIRLRTVRTPAPPKSRPWMHELTPLGPDVELQSFSISSSPCSSVGMALVIVSA